MSCKYSTEFTLPIITASVKRVPLYKERRLGCGRAWRRTGLPSQAGLGGQAGGQAGGRAGRRAGQGGLGRAGQGGALWTSLKCAFLLLSHVPCAYHYYYDYYDAEVIILS